MSVRDKLLEDVEFTLLQMQEGNGYFYDWQRVYRFSQSTPLDSFPAALIETDREEVEPVAYPVVRRLLPLRIIGAAKVPHTLDDDPDQAASRMIADIERAMVQDVTRAGNAIDTIPTANDRDYSVPDMVFVEVEFQVIYRTLFGDPSSAH